MSVLAVDSELVLMLDCPYLSLLVHSLKGRSLQGPTFLVVLKAVSLAAYSETLQQELQ